MAKILHLFHRYLDVQSNWVYNNIKPIKDHSFIIAAPEFINNKFQDLGFCVFPKLNLTFLSLFKRFNNNYIKHWMFKNINNFDIIHCHFSFVGYTFIDSALKTHKPLITSFYGFDYEYLPSIEPVWKKRYTKLFEVSSAIICEGEYAKKTLIKLNCPESKIKVIPLGVNLSIAQRKKDFVFKKENSLKLVQIASFKEKKAQLDSIKSCHKLIKDNLNITLTFYGDGPNKKECIEYCNTHNLKHIYFNDTIPFEKLYSVLEKYDVLIQPSKYSNKNDCEGGAPVILLDAMALGIPVLSTFHCDIPNIVIDNKTGFLVNEGDIDTMTNTIEKVYRMKPEEYQILSTNCIAHIKKNFDSNNCSKKTSQLYHQLCR